MSASPIISDRVAARRTSPLADELSAIFATIDDEPILGVLSAYRWILEASRGLVEEVTLPAAESLLVTASRRV